jgi:hypothetical protein
MGLGSDQPAIFWFFRYMAGWCVGRCDRKEEEVSKRKATNGNNDGRLTPQQCTAVDLLVSGKTLTDTAEAIGVGRPAVSDWCNHFPPFIAALGARRQELWESQVDTLRNLLPKALSVLEKELDGPQPLPAALAILKSCGLASGLGRPAGPATLEEAEHA